MRNKALSVCVGILVTVFIAGCTRNDYDNSETDTYTESLTDEIYSSQDSEISNPGETSTYIYENDTLEDFEDNPITMKEAYEIAYEDAVKWSDDVTLIRIGSTDNHDTSSKEHGVDGKRNCWSVLFDSQKKGIQYHTYVICGRAMFGGEGNSPGYKAIDITDLEDSPYLYKKALENDISAGYDFAWGYHYTLQYYIFDGDRDNPVLRYAVRGRDAEGREAILYIDAVTGTADCINVKTGYDINGRSIWTELVKNNDEQTESNEITETYEIKDEDYYRNMSIEEFDEQFNLFENCVKYMRDPKELREAIIKGILSNSFHPYIDAGEYEEEEWRKRMTDYYGEGWEERMKDIDVSDSMYWN
ncbi:uncharacterized protein BN803_02572 [Firmicutes bacterium CAG:882]|jgi:hypothetical protein|nr:uncharacterized protein BN803_02572 [Firmicutes bacterium CAG:882]